jgi:hypothetical protein
VPENARKQTHDGIHGSQRPTDIVGAVQQAAGDLDAALAFPSRGRPSRMPGRVNHELDGAEESGEFGSGFGVQMQGGMVGRKVGILKGRWNSYKIVFPQNVGFLAPRIINQ